MMWGWDGWSWLGWTLMSVSMVVIWGAVIWGLVMVVRRSADERDQRPDPEQVLAERFAAGEIDEEEYLSRLHTLRSPNERPTGALR